MNISNFLLQIVQSTKCQHLVHPNLTLCQHPGAGCTVLYYKLALVGLVYMN